MENSFLNCLKKHESCPGYRKLDRPRDRTSEKYHGYCDQLTELLKTALSGEVFTKEDEDIMNFIKNAEIESRRHC